MIPTLTQEGYCEHADIKLRWKARVLVSLSSN
jgi:hypothetical protein